MSDQSDLITLWDYRNPTCQLQLNLRTGHWVTNEMSSVDEARQGAKGLGAEWRIGLSHRRTVLIALVLRRTRWSLRIDDVWAELSEGNVRRRTLFPCIKSFAVRDESGLTHQYCYWWTDLLEDGQVERDFHLYVARVARSPLEQQAMADYWGDREGPS